MKMKAPSIAASAIAVFLLGMAAGGPASRAAVAGSETPAAAPKSPECTFSPLADTSSFESELYKDEYPETDGPADARDLKWDFSGKKIFAYDYSQKLRNRVQVVGFEENVDQKAYARGVMKVESQGGGKAKVTVGGLKLKLDPEGMPPEMAAQIDPNKEQDLPPFTIDPFMDDGSFKPSKGGQDLPLSFLFAMPGKAIAKGMKIPKPMEFSSGNLVALAKIKGTTTFTLVKYVLIGKRKCAMLEGDIDISDFSIPRIIPGDYQMALRGKSVVYYDLEQRCVAAGGVAMVISVRMSMNTPDFAKATGEEVPEDMPEIICSSMEADSLVSIRLKGVP